MVLFQIEMWFLFSNETTCSGGQIGTKALGPRASTDLNPQVAYCEEVLRPFLAACLFKDKGECENRKPCITIVRRSNSVVNEPECKSPFQFSLSPQLVTENRRFKWESKEISDSKNNLPRYTNKGAGTKRKSRSLIFFSLTHTGPLGKLGAECPGL